jgi:hypothetical protein
MDNAINILPIDRSFRKGSLLRFQFPFTLHYVRSVCVHKSFCDEKRASPRTAGKTAEDQTTAAQALPTGWHHVAATIDAVNKASTPCGDGQAVVSWFWANKWGCRCFGLCLSGGLCLVEKYSQFFRPRLDYPARFCYNTLYVYDLCADCAGRLAANRTNTEGGLEHDDLKAHTPIPAIGQSECSQGLSLFYLSFWCCLRHLRYDTLVQLTDRLSSGAKQRLLGKDGVK